MTCAPSNALEELVVVVQRRGALHPHAVGLLEVDEQQADLGVHEDVAEAAEHPVAVVARERERAVVDDPDEAGHAALVRAVRPPVGVGGGEEEHGGALDDLAVAVRERVVHRDLFEPVGDPPAVEARLHLAGAVVVHVGQLASCAA